MVLYAWPVLRVDVHCFQIHTHAHTPNTTAMNCCKNGKTGRGEYARIMYKWETKFTAVFKNSFPKYFCKNGIGEYARIMYKWETKFTVVFKNSFPKNFCKNGRGEYARIMYKWETKLTAVSKNSSALFVTSKGPARDAPTLATHWNALLYVIFERTPWKPLTTAATMTSSASISPAAHGKRTTKHNHSEM